MQKGEPVQYTVMIVDDDDLNREVMEAFLDLQGYAVLMTGSGLKALEIAEAKLPHLIILDKRLPDLDGLDVCRSLKSSLLTCDIPVMMITGLSDMRTRQQALEAGVDVFFPRPFDGDDFIVAVTKILSHQN